MLENCCFNRFFKKKRLGEDNPEVEILPTFKHFLKLIPLCDIIYFYNFLFTISRPIHKNIIKNIQVLLWWKLCYF